MANQDTFSNDSKFKESKLFKKFFGDVSTGKEIIVTITSLLTGIIFISKLGAPIKDFNNFSLVIEGLNIIVLIVGLIIFSRTYNYHLPEEPERLKILIAQEVVKKPCDESNRDLEEKDIEAKMSKRVTRVSQLVSQLLIALKGFAICLILLYAFLFFADFNNKKEEESRSAIQKKTKAILQGSLKEAGNYAALIKTSQIDTINILRKDSLGISDTFKIYGTAVKTHTAVFSHYLDSLKNQLDSLKNIDSLNEQKYTTYASLTALVLTRDITNKTVLNDILITLLDNFLNVLSTAFLIMAFYILYHQTIDINNGSNENARLNQGYLASLLIAMIIISISTVTVIIGFPGQNLQSLIICMRIVSGIYNGVGMALLVSRFISMEYFYKKSDDAARNFYLIGTIVILPIYAVVQPLWGIFQTNIQNREILKEIILMLCLWGKIFFVMIIYYMLKNRWIHTYIYSLPIAEEKMNLITFSFDDKIVRNIKKETGSQLNAAEDPNNYKI